MKAFEELKTELKRSRRSWLVTGAAGFIGSNIVEALLKLDQDVVGLDNFSTGRRDNINELQSKVSTQQWSRFALMEEDIRDPSACLKACSGIDHVLHQAALGSVPRSMLDPKTSHDANVNGFLNVLEAARIANVKCVVYASSSSVYGDHPALPKVEARIGRCLSPYAATKLVNELYADVFGRCYGLHTVGLRYFNVFGPRQDPEGPYAAVIPKWVSSLLQGGTVFINGDGETSRDFCFVANVIQANLLAAVRGQQLDYGEVFNIASCKRTSLTSLFTMIKARLLTLEPKLAESMPTYREFRSGDVRHSHADISKARALLAYEPTHSVEQGLDEALPWYVLHLQPKAVVCDQ